MLLDEKTKILIREFIETITSTHDEKYPSCDEEKNALVDAICSDFKISKRDAIEAFREYKTGQGQKQGE